MTADAREATASYLDWLGGRIPLVAEDLRAKAAAMAADPLRFLRGSYYLWLVRVAEEIPDLLAAPLLVAVGDAHVENFGIWLDEEGRRVWGVNDFDEIGLGPYALDLVRTAASAIVSTRLDRGLRLHGADVAELLLEGWTRGVEEPVALVLDGEAHRHLSALSPAGDPRPFWEKLEAGPPAAEVPDAARLVAGSGLTDPVWRRRQAGTGSLGHRRLAVLGRLGGARVAREAKELGPPTADWPGLDGVTDAWMGTAAGAWAAVGGMPGFPPGARRVEGWVGRRLGPEAGRIELADLDRRRDESALVRSMGRALGAVHAASTDGRVAALAPVGGPDALSSARHHARRWGVEGLRRAAETMAASVVHDFHRCS